MAIRNCAISLGAYLSCHNAVTELFTDNGCFDVLFHIVVNIEFMTKPNVKRWKENNTQFFNYWPQGMSTKSNIKPSVQLSFKLHVSLGNGFDRMLFRNVCDNYDKSFKNNPA